MERICCFTNFIQQWEANQLKKAWCGGKNFMGILYEPGSKLLVLGMVIQPLIWNPYNGAL